MGSRIPGKKPDGKEGISSPPPRLLRPRGVCFRCHLPVITSCICPSPDNSRKPRLPATPVSSESASVKPAPILKRKIPSENTLATRNKGSSSRRQLFKGTCAVNDGTAGVAATASVVSPDEVVSELSPLPHPLESTSSHVTEQDYAIPSTSSDPAPSTSSTDPQASKSKRKKKKLKILGRHVCRICSKIFGSPGKLNQHMFSHTGEKPFECEKCMKAFSSKFKLVRHLLIHSDERQYCCTMCDRTFHRKDHLKNHFKVHSPVKKTFRCDRLGCHKIYSSLLSYRKHAAVHSAEEGDLDCKMCGKSFVTKDEIVYHLKVHAGSRTVKNASDKKYRCEFCERRFFTRKDVRRHLVVHTGKRDFLCQFCPQRFGRKDHLVRHIKKSHSNMNVSVPSRASLSKGKRPRVNAGQDVNVSSSLNTGSSHAGRPREGSRTPVRSKTTLPTETHIDLTSDLQNHGSARDTLMIMEGTTYSGGMKQMELKQEETFSDLKVESLIETANESASFGTDIVKVEDCALMQPLMYSQPPPPYPDHLAVDPVGNTVKSEPSLTSLSVGMDMNQFVTGLLSSSGGDGNVSSEPIGGQHEAGGEVTVNTDEAPSGEMSEAEASDFLVHFPNEEFLQLIELSIPSSTTTTTSTTSGDMNTDTAPLPRFNQAFQQQPPP